ncbi:MAG: hypothetical protein ACXAC8_04535 [Candidatus Hodarchaeales archaeon]|jgi:hypothetical protein
MGYNFPNDKSRTIELDSRSYLVVTRSTHHLLGEVIEVNQLVKNGGQMNELGPIHFPLNQMGKEAIQQLGEFYEVIVAEVKPTNKFQEWLKEEVKGQAVKKRMEDFQTTLRKLSPQRFVEDSDTGELSVERLSEPVPNSPFIVDDVIHAVQTKTQFAEPLKVPLNQMKPIIFFSLAGGQDMITGDVPKIFLNQNIEYDFKRTSVLLKELVDAGFLELEDRISRNNRRYTVWKFSKAVNPFVDDIGEEVE